MLGMPQRGFTDRTKARSAAYQSWATTPDRAGRTASARAAFLDRFEAQVDPDGLLPEAQRRQRAEAARKAHFLDLAAKSAAARRARRAQP